MKRNDDGLGAAVARARLALDDEGDGALEELEVIWRQTLKKSGDGHFGYRIAFDSGACHRCRSYVEFDG